MILPWSLKPKKNALEKGKNMLIYISVIVADIAGLLLLKFVEFIIDENNDNKKHS